eukprot:766829-Pyramimonas_sp.AAC.1
MSFRLPANGRRADPRAQPRVPEPVLLPLILCLAERGGGPDGPLSAAELAAVRQEVAHLPADVL